MIQRQGDWEFEALIFSLAISVSTLHMFTLWVLTLSLGGRGSIHCTLQDLKPFLSQDDAFVVSCHFDVDLQPVSTSMFGRCLWRGTSGTSPWTGTPCPRGLGMGAVPLEPGTWLAPGPQASVLSISASAWVSPSQLCFCLLLPQSPPILFHTPGKSPQAQQASEKPNKPDCFSPCQESRAFLKSESHTHTKKNLMTFWWGKKNSISQNVFLAIAKWS